MNNFDQVVNRVGTDSVKWNGHKDRNMPSDLLPLWVADMDFASPKEVVTAIQERAAHPIYGYAANPIEYYQSVQNWMKTRHNWIIEKEWIVCTSGVVGAVKLAINAYTKPGDAILLSKPVYYPFDASIEANNRVIIESELVVEDGQYIFDRDDFEKQIIEHNVKMYILCNPHNPIGKVWTKEELQDIIDICYKHQVFIISDEIHMDFIFKPNIHIPLYEVDSKAKEIAIICTSPSKTFNLAGLQVSNIVIASDQLRTKFRNTKMMVGMGDPNIFALVATMAAYNHCGYYVDEMNEYIKGNFEYVQLFLQEELPMIQLIKPQGLYLAWLDFRQLGMDPKELEQFMIKDAKLWLDEGYIFGTGGDGFERYNLATPRINIEQAMNQLKNALEAKNIL